MTEVTDLDGVGPARSDDLDDAGYGSVEVLADADPETLAEEADLPNDRALDFVVQAQNVVESEDAESEDNSEAAVASSDGAEEKDGPSPVDLVEDDETSEETAENEDDAQPELEEVDTYEVVVDLETDLHYDAYMTALFNAYERRYGSHQPTLDAINYVLSDARHNDGTITHELTEFDLNSLHAAVSQQSTDYKGNNMIDHMDAMDDVLEQINAVRREELF